MDAETVAQLVCFIVAMYGLYLSITIDDEE